VVADADSQSTVVLHAASNDEAGQMTGAEFSSRPPDKDHHHHHHHHHHQT